MKKDVDWINREVECIYDILGRAGDMVANISPNPLNPGGFYENIDRVAALHRLLCSTDVIARMDALIDFADFHVNKSYSNEVELPNEEESADHG